MHIRWWTVKWVSSEEQSLNRGMWLRGVLNWLSHGCMAYVCMYVCVNSWTHLDEYVNLVRLGVQSRVSRKLYSESEDSYFPYHSSQFQDMHTKILGGHDWSEDWIFSCRKRIVAAFSKVKHLADALMGIKSRYAREITWSSYRCSCNWGNEPLQKVLFNQYSWGRGGGVWGGLGASNTCSLVKVLALTDVCAVRANFFWSTE